MKPDRAEEIPWERCTRINLHDGRVFAVGVRTASYDSWEQNLYFVDAAKPRVLFDEASVPIELVKKVTCGRGLADRGAILRELDDLNAADMLMLAGHDLEGFDALTPSQQKAVLVTHHALRNPARHLDQLNREREEAERVRREAREERRKERRKAARKREYQRRKQREQVGA